MPRWRRWPDDDQSRRGRARSGASTGLARQAGDGRPGDAGGPAGEAGPGLRGRGPAGGPDPRRQGGPGLAGLAGTAAPRRAGAARGAAGADVAAAVGAAYGPDAGELRLRVPAGRAAVQAGRAGDLRLAAGEAGAADPRPPGRGEDSPGHRAGGAGGGVRLLGGVLIIKKKAARDAQGRPGAAGAAEGQEVHEGGPGDHRRGGLRDVHPRGGEPVLPAGELSLPAGVAVHHLEQGDQGLAGDAGRGRGDHGGDPGPAAALVPRAEHPRPELPASRPGGRLERAVVSAWERRRLSGRGVPPGSSATILEEPATAIREGGQSEDIVSCSLVVPFSETVLEEPFTVAKGTSRRARSEGRGPAVLVGASRRPCTPSVLFSGSGPGGAVAEIGRRDWVGTAGSMSSAAEEVGD